MLGEAVDGDVGGGEADTVDDALGAGAARDLHHLGRDVTPAQARAQAHLLFQSQDAEREAENRITVAV